MNHDPLVGAPAADPPPLAELAYAPPNERVAVRAALAIVMAFPAASVVYEITLLSIFLIESVGGSVARPTIQRSVAQLAISGLRIASGVTLILIAHAGRRDRRVGPTAFASLGYAIITVVAAFGTTVDVWLRLGKTAFPFGYLVQIAITNLASGIVPFVSFVVLRQLAASQQETA